MSPLERLRWLRLIAGTPSLPPTAMSIAVVIAGFLNNDSGSARPAVATIADELHLDPRTVQRSVRALEVAGLLTVEHTAGRACCTYTPTSNPGSSARVEPRQQRQGSEAPTPAAWSPNPGSLVPQPRRQRHPNMGGHGNEQGERRAQRFAPPTLTEVSAYCAVRANGIDPQRFLNYYAARGWLMGKTKVKDWKACVRTWESRSQTSTAANETALPPPYYPTADEAAAALGITSKDSP